MIAPLTLHRVHPRPWLTRLAEGNTNVPCGECHTCCRGAFHVDLEPSEDASQYRTHFNDTMQAHVLDKNEDGSCVYLKDGRCAIYARRPRACRRFDCRVYPFAKFAVSGVESERDYSAVGWSRFGFHVWDAHANGVRAIAIMVTRAAVKLGVPDPAAEACCIAYVFMKRGAKALRAAISAYCQHWGISDADFWAALPGCADDLRGEYLQWLTGEAQS